MQGLRLVRDWPRPSVSAAQLTGGTALFIVLCDHHAFWRAVVSGVGGLRDGAFHLLTLGLILALLLHLLLSLFAVRPLLKPTLMLVLVITAVSSYFMDVYGVVIDDAMIRNVLETDWREASELLTLPLFRHLLVHGLAPVAIVALVRVRFASSRRELRRRLGGLLVSLLLLAGLGVADYKFLVLFGRQHRELRMMLNPSYPVYSTVKALWPDRQVLAAGGRLPVAVDAVCSDSQSRRVFVLVLGETARAEEFALNGYYRPTNPLLSQRQVVNFPRTEACGTSTAESLPCIFSHLGHGDYSVDKANRYDNLLDILQRTGVQVLWLDNNSGSKGVADRVLYQSLSGAGEGTLCGSGECFDEILLEGLDDRLATNTGPLLVVLHQKGSHGPSYYKRTPETYKRFFPECTKDNVQDCEQDTIVNAYDNTILYTDYVLASLIDLLEKQDYASAMLYVSDHGESLGEKNIYLHGLPYLIAPEQQTHVPMIFWGSKSFLLQEGIDASCLDSVRNARYSHDNLFHSLLGIFDVRTSSYDPALDLFAACRAPRS